MSQEAVEDAARWIHHDPDVSSPNNEIARLRMLHPLKVIRSLIEIRRTRVRIGEARPIVNCMHQVRAIPRTTHAGAPVEGYGDYFQTVVSRQRISSMFSIHLHAANCARSAGILGT